MYVIFQILLLLFLGLVVSYHSTNTIKSKRYIKNIKLFVVESENEGNTENTETQHNQVDYSNFITSNDDYININNINNDMVSNKVQQIIQQPYKDVDSLRKKYGTNKNLFGDWSFRETREFYKKMLPYTLQIDGALGMSLEERAIAAVEARRAVRIYCRERCVLPGRVISKLYDGLRSFSERRKWNTEGLSWEDLKEKYAKEGLENLGADASEDLLMMYVYSRVLEKSCETNDFFDKIAILDLGTKAKEVPEKTFLPSWRTLIKLRNTATQQTKTQKEKEDAR